MLPSIYSTILDNAFLSLPSVFFCADLDKNVKTDRPLASLVFVVVLSHVRVFANLCNVFLYFLGRLSCSWMNTLLKKKKEYV